MVGAGPGAFSSSWLTTITYPSHFPRRPLPVPGDHRTRGVAFFQKRQCLDRPFAAPCGAGGRVTQPLVGLATDCSGAVKETTWGVPAPDTAPPGAPRPPRRVAHPPPPVGCAPGQWRWRRGHGATRPGRPRRSVDPKRFPPRSCLLHWRRLSFFWAGRDATARGGPCCGGDARRSRGPRGPRGCAARVTCPHRPRDGRLARHAPSRGRRRGGTFPPDVCAHRRASKEAGKQVEVVG